LVGEKFWTRQKIRKGGGDHELTCGPEEISRDAAQEQALARKLFEGGVKWKRTGSQTPPCLKRTGSKPTLLGEGGGLRPPVTVGVERRVKGGERSRDGAKRMAKKNNYQKKKNLWLTRSCRCGEASKEGKGQRDLGARGAFSAMGKRRASFFGIGRMKGRALSQVINEIFLI